MVSTGLISKWHNLPQDVACPVVAPHCECAALSTPQGGQTAKALPLSCFSCQARFSFLCHSLSQVLLPKGINKGINKQTGRVGCQPGQQDPLRAVLSSCPLSSGRQGVSRNWVLFGTMKMKHRPPLHSLPLVILNCPNCSKYFLFSFGLLCQVL